MKQITAIIFILLQSFLNFGQLNTFIVDDYPITENMLKKRKSEIKINGLATSDQVWFTNKNLNQTIIIYIYTDYHRVRISHFKNDEILKQVIEGLEFNTENGGLATFQQKEKSINSFIEKANEIPSKYFYSDKGMHIGTKKSWAIHIYGNPHKYQKINNYEIFIWEFVGDITINKHITIKNKVFAKNSFGHQITMIFKNGKLIGHILYNAIP